MFMAGSISIVKSTFQFLEPFLMRKVKVGISTQIKQYKPYTSSLFIRLLYEPPIKYRQPVKIQDLPVERGKWVKGEYYIELHDARNLHHDFTIIVEGKAYRMARAATPGTSPKMGYLNVFPGLGEKTGWIAQPEHFLHEVPNPSIIEEGYGKGTCKVIKHANCFVMVSEDNNMHVIFEDIDGVYTFVETKDNQVIMLRKHSESQWIGKHRMIDGMNAQPYIENKDYAFFVKKDGAAVEWQVVKGSNGKKYLRVHSYRQDMVAEQKFGTTVQIDHTYRLHMCDQPLPDDTPISSGRGELWCQGPSGRLHVASIMNSSHYKARNSKHRPYLYVHDVHTYNGKDVSHEPYGQKLQYMEELHDTDLRFKVPEYAVTPKGKQALYDRTENHWREGTEAVDGVVAWNMNEGDTKAVKLKFTHSKEHWHSATIVDTVPQGGEHGDKYHYPILENNKGVKFQASGKGLTNERKADLASNPDDYIGMEVRYAADSHFEEGSGKPFQPTIKEWNAV
jgi:hypothetical protein